MNKKMTAGDVKPPHPKKAETSRGVIRTTQTVIILRVIDLNYTTKEKIYTSVK